MDCVMIQHRGRRIAVSFHRTVGDIRKLRYLSRQEALACGVLMSGGAPIKAIDLEVGSGLTLQIINAPYNEAFFSVLDPAGGRTLVVRLNDNTITSMGKKLVELGTSVLEPSSSNDQAFHFAVSDSYLDEAEPN